MDLADLLDLAVIFAVGVAIARYNYLQYKRNHSPDDGKNGDQIVVENNEKMSGDENRAPVETITRHVNVGTKNGIVRLTNHGTNRTELTGAQGRKMLDCDIDTAINDLVARG